MPGRTHIQRMILRSFEDHFPCECMETISYSYFYVAFPKAAGPSLDSHGMAEAALLWFGKGVTTVWRPATQVRLDNVHPTLYWKYSEMNISYASAHQIHIQDLNLAASIQPECEGRIYIKQHSSRGRIQNTAQPCAVESRLHCIREL
jgi:hypothetical protein